MKRKRGKEMGKYKYLVIFIALVTFGLVGCGNTNTSDKGT